MKDYRNYLLPALIIIILLFWFDRGNNRKELKRSDKVFKDSIYNLQALADIQEIEISNSRDTIRQLKAGLKALQSTTAKSKSVKVKVLAEPKIIVPDSILVAYQVVKERLEQDSSRIFALQMYSNDLENELRESGKIIKSQDFEIKGLNAMTETNKLIIEQLNARHENDKELFKNERRLKRKWMITSGGLAILLILAL